jgi:Yqey-like protein
MPTMGQAFAERLKQALKARDARTVSTVRLMLAALNERDVAARGRANVGGVSEAEFFTSPNPRQPRISAENEMSIADNLWAKQQKQREPSRGPTILCIL